MPQPGTPTAHTMHTGATVHQSQCEAVRWDGAAQHLIALRGSNL